MSFQAPLFLLGLLAIPLGLASLALARRRPERYVIRFPAVPTVVAVLFGAAAYARSSRPRSCASRSPDWPSRSRDPRRRSRCPTSAPR